MQTFTLTDMRKKPPHNMDVLANAVFGDYSPVPFRPGVFYGKGSIVYTHDETGDITVWKCNKSGVYEKAIEPGWEVWSIDDVRTRLSIIEDMLRSNYDLYDTRSYAESYYLHDVGIRDWERRGSFFEVFHNRRYFPKKNYRVIEERVEPLEGVEKLPDETKAVMYLSKSNNKMTNLVRRIELDGIRVNRSRYKIPFPADEEMLISYFFDVFVDGVYISPRFYEIDTLTSGDKCVVFDFNYNGIRPMFKNMIEEKETLTFIPPVTMRDDSEVIFVFYISISHDLMISCKVTDIFIGDPRDTKWVDTAELEFRDKLQEAFIYNNGIRMREGEYTISTDRICIDKEENRFVLGSFASIVMREFMPVVDEAVTNVKQETVPTLGTQMGIMAIPFLNYDGESDHFLMFNDGGILFGSQRWFEDNGYVNIYDGNLDLEPTEMVEFRMISRDKNMRVTTYMLTATTDGQMTFITPEPLRDHYFHMIFTENGQFFSRTKYALSGEYLQIRKKYSKYINAGERLEVICFDYNSDYGFTSLTNFQSLWNTEYTLTEIDNLPHPDNDELDPSEPEPDEPETDYDINDLQFDPITNPNRTKLTYRPATNPGTTWIRVQDTPLSSLISNKIEENMAFVCGVDCDNQIIVSTSNGSIVRFDRSGREDVRYFLKWCANNVLQSIVTDDFGCSYFLSYSTRVVGKAHLLGDNNLIWRHDMNDDRDDWKAQVDFMADMRSITYYNRFLYLEYSTDAGTKYRIGKIDADTGVFTKINFDMSQLPANVQVYCAKISTINGMIYFGSVGHTVYEFYPDGRYSRTYQDIVTAYEAGVVENVHADKNGHVYAICINQDDRSSAVVRYDPDNMYNPIIKYYGEWSDVKVAFDVDSNCYLYDGYSMSIIKLDAETLDTVWTYTREDFGTGVSSCQNLFVDQVDYHVYMYYYSSNKEEKYRYLELEQNELPLPKYRHAMVCNGTESVTMFMPPTSARDLSWRMPESNRIYIVGMTGNIFTFTQTTREYTKREQDGSLRINGNQWKSDNLDENVFIIPDDEYNYYAIKKDVIVKFSRYDRALWTFDGAAIIGDISDRIVYNRMSKSLTFFYTDKVGMNALGTITNKGEFSVVTLTLPNNVPIENSDCAIAVDNMGNYYFGYTGKTVYRYSKNFNHLWTYGHNTDMILDGPVGDIVVFGITSPSYIYVSVKDDLNGNKYSKIIKYNNAGTLLWEHDFLNASSHAKMVMDADGNVYMCDEKEIRKLDANGNYVWRFRYEKELVKIEPDHILIDEFYRIFFMDSDRSIHRIDQYDITLSPVPDEPKDPPEPKDPTPEEPAPENYIKVQRTFDIPFEYDEETNGMLLFTNTGQYIGNRFWELRRGKIYLKGAPVYENGWLDIIRIQNEKESVMIEGRRT